MKKKTPRDGVYVLNADFTVKTCISWQRAVEAIVDKTAYPFKVHQTERVRSAGGTVDMAKPQMIVLKYWKPSGKYKQKKTKDLNTRASKTEILERDQRTCAYCGKHATTVDHIKPESRCKKDGDAEDGWTWGNLVAACFDCNNWKDDRTPEEAGMKLLWGPYVVTDKYHNVQKEVWSILNSGNYGYDMSDMIIPDMN